MLICFFNYYYLYSKKTLSGDNNLNVQFEKQSLNMNDKR